MLRGGQLLSFREQLKEFKEQNKSVAFHIELTEKIKVILKLESSLEESNAKLAGMLKKLSSENQKVFKARGERDQLARSIRQRKEELESMPQKEPRLANLELMVEVTESSCKVLYKEYEQARIQELKKGNHDIRVITPAFPPPERPVKPIKILYAAAAFFMAFLSGLLFVLFYESLNETLDNVIETEEALNLPVIATLPLRRFY